MGTKITEAERHEVLASLRAWVPEGGTVYTVVHTVARSGMSRTMSMYTVVEGEIFTLNAKVAALGIGKLDKDGRLIVQGTGMDMGFHVVYSLSVTMFGRAGGYSLKQRWI